MKTAIQAELPEQLAAEARAFVEQGWVGNFDELLAEALRRYLESRSTQLAESFIQEDVVWGFAWPRMSLRRRNTGYDCTANE
jgi:hypothetical protein